MYKILKSAFLLLMAMAIAQCSKDDKAPETPKFKDFSIEKTEISLVEKQKGSIKITSGNEDYQIIASEESKKIASASITSDKKSIEITAIQEGKTEISIKDNKVPDQVKTIRISVSAKPKDFSVEKTEIVVKINETTSVTILSGNDEYEIQNSEIAKVSLSADKKSFQIEGVKIGKAEVIITDKKTNHSVTLSISVNQFVEDVDYTLSSDKLTLLKWKNTSVKQINLKTDSVLSKITKIGENAFKESQIEAIIFPETLKTIGKDAFITSIHLKTIKFNEELTEISESAFGSCHNLTQISIPNSVTSIGKSAFANNENLASITLPEGLKTIEDATFNLCGFTSITLPKTITAIGNEAFNSCKKLTKITIPENVKSIGENAFGDCEKLTEVTVKAQTPPALSEENIGDEDDQDEENASNYNEEEEENEDDGDDNSQEGGVFPSNLKTIYVPKGKADIYKNASGWSNYKSKIQEEK
ncbi:MAG: leucine-rich repeat domain-containing protein [Capnocytophaga sp.]|nr:leucine-rich repeat domain-containing protein [Capnocytophaga sp.]